MTRHRPKFQGLFHDETDAESFWIRDRATLALPAFAAPTEVVVSGRVLPPDPTEPSSAGDVGVTVRFGPRVVASSPRLAPGPFRLAFRIEPRPGRAGQLGLELHGVAGGNFLAWLGRVSGLGPLQPWRRQARNRRLRIARVEADGETLFDFGNRSAPWNLTFARRFLDVGLNVVGFFRADLGVAESARCMVRAADAAGLPAAAVDLRLHCKNPFTDDTFLSRLQPDAPHRFTVVHVDPPGMRDLDHCHGRAFRAGKYTIGYWAWELPEFPDAWIGHAQHCDEVWTPSRFAAEAIAEKVPVPVLVMPHSISFRRPEGDCRAKFGLPRDKFLFLFLYDLNSYSERKNPAAVLEAFRRSGLAGRGAALVIKVHNAAGNPADFARLEASVATIPDTTLINATLHRNEVYELESACDCFVSLHRAEGFGFAVAEAMYLGKPVISTDWSATAEFVTAENGCPVRARLVALDRNHGPYAKGQTWAEPDLDDAAAQMRRLFADRALCARLGAAARATIERRFAPEVVGARYRRRLEALASA